MEDSINRQTQAKNNLEKKYTDAFKTVFSNRKRITGKSIDLGILYAEVRAKRKTLIESYKTLKTGVSRAGRATLSNLSADMNENRSDADEANDTDEENEEDTDNGYNIKQGFRGFTTIFRNLAKSHGLFVNGNLQQLL
ncbi:hypothetical protein G6F70_003208 [Rhizopus microsporus]|nr:hypothetical protein G6F71_002873 [Rhizopus microsporus]KAG1201395.1 hypothetical protein G6F70_003208 [Rhizopus microsporus]KAG1214651.1 hypothetical protein G6F69_001757 [Rhizopus microsporus]KAG1235757.1 hypothetical protein G6F67_002531 [Rhizopus microsporus]KAG1267053.1 hypothetical protein G6F68_002261 [Rhizopus microsporus]